MTGAGVTVVGTVGEVVVADVGPVLATGVVPAWTTKEGSGFSVGGVCGPNGTMEMLPAMGF